MKTRNTQIAELREQIAQLSQAVEAAAARSRSDALDRVYESLCGQSLGGLEPMARRFIEGGTTPEDNAIIASLNADDVAASGMSINEFFGAMYRLSEKY